MAIRYANLFWPDFIEHDNCTFLKAHFSIDTCKHLGNPNLSENYAQIESLINQMHIVDLFATTVRRPGFLNRVFNKHPEILPIRNDITKEQVVYLGNKLLETDTTILSVDYPERTVDLPFDFVDNPKNRQR